MTPTQVGFFNKKRLVVLPQGRNALNSFLELEFFITQHEFFESNALFLEAVIY